MNRSHRTSIAKQTLEIIEQGYYTTDAGHRVSIKQEVESSVALAKCYTPSDFETLSDQLVLDTTENQTLFNLTNTTTLVEAGNLLKKQNGDVTCLNFASAKNPGGGFLNGSQAQEESLARSSTLYPTLLKNEIYYTANRQNRSSLYTDHMIYSPQVLVIRTDEGELLEQPLEISVVTAPAVNAGAVKNNEPDNVKYIEPIMLQRMENLLKLCIHEKCENLVLGAWGCGVFMNNPQVIAEMWYSLLIENTSYKNKFRHITFAVLDRRDRGIYSAFEQCLSRIL